MRKTPFAVAALAAIGLTSAAHAGAATVDNDGQYRIYGTVGGVTVAGYGRNTSCSVTTDFRGPAGTSVEINQSAYSVWLDGVGITQRQVDGPVRFTLPASGYAQVIIPKDFDVIVGQVKVVVAGNTLVRPVPRFGTDWNTGANPHDCGRDPEPTTTVAPTTTAPTTTSSTPTTAPSTTSTTATSTSTTAPTTTTETRVTPQPPPGVGGPREDVPSDGGQPKLDPPLDPPHTLYSPPATKPPVTPPGDCRTSTGDRCPIPAKTGGDPLAMVLLGVGGVLGGSGFIYGGRKVRLATVRR